ncbi:tRNA(Met) cytidine acetyltransferase TmcA [Natronolimnobius baerhuensis]|uniref:tRNA(Met) cytidine acetyltransferase TmcA n=1 Tax=Natronolimnobius baerhuensis TaxID=253108 RepID=A0A202E844_9EURY|nr:tRNA(Met) cytidine acetyltransferase TmcA [Natronolimnobius baerhuensis]OVE84130.1 tRNA cytosine(34) acetyltransferase TmcA [Natronolimnobius baerhuensis]
MDVDAVSLAESLLEEATQTNERRALVLAGEREQGYRTLESVLDALPVGITETTLVGPEDRLRCEHVQQVNASQLLGTTRTIATLDASDDLQPNALGKVVGAVDGGGLLILLTPPLEEWPDRQGAFAESLAVPPFALSDVTGRFQRRLAETLRAHRGIGIVDLETDTVVDDGHTNPAPSIDRQTADWLESAPGDRTGGFPPESYAACLTGDQANAVGALESLHPDSDNSDSQQRSVVLEADRGRGKSSAAGVAAGAFAADGLEVLVTAPAARNAAEVFERATALCETLSGSTVTATGPRQLETDAGGRVHFLEPAEALDGLADADIVIVDEAAALPVSRLEAFLAADRIAFATTIHGYEGAGRGFSVRFRDRLAESDHAVTDCTLVEPIRYAAGDPLEVWAFRALLLDARPPVEPLVADAGPETVTYRRLEPDDLLADEQLLCEAFGLLVLAHYRTEPNDLARLLDAPNLEARALCHDGHVVSVALLAREGGLEQETRTMMYEGGRVRGNMLPDILTSQLRDEAAAEPAGVRIVRIATHHAVRSQGLGSHLLECIRNEFKSKVDWLGTAFGATPGLLEFWRESGSRAIHLSTTRNDASGEYSVLMLAPLSDAGRTLAKRHATWFADRFGALCSDKLGDLEPDVARAVLRSVDADAAPTLHLSDHDWRVVAGAAYGPGLFDVNPSPFRQLAVRYLIERPDGLDLTTRRERLLILRVLQTHDWEHVADRLEYHSTGQCMRALGDAFQPLVDHYGVDDGVEVAHEVRERFLEE